MEEILNVFVHSALVDNLCNDSLEQLTHVCGGSLTDKQKGNAAKALELIAQSKTDGDPDEGRPESIEEIDQYEWITTDGHLGVMFDGLPKYLA